MTGAMTTNVVQTLTHLEWQPLVPVVWLGIFAAIGVGIALYGLWRRANGSVLRLLVLGLIIGLLANPVVRRENRQPVADIALVALDESPSQQINGRMGQAMMALEDLTRQAAGLDNLEWRVVRAGQKGVVDETTLFGALDQALQDVPPQRIAATIIISDGQIHDIPADWPKERGPLHLLLTGQPGEKDRRLRLIEAPAFGLVGQDAMVTLRIEDLSDNPGHEIKDVPLVIRRNQEEPIRVIAQTGSDQYIKIPVTHAGENIIDLAVDEWPGEVSTLNNHTQIVINGVRDRLKVLLVSGEPHAGERTWRNLLKSDPSVDLVHFTILRTPEKLDSTPIRELSLIAFPVRELFEIKLHDFDLVIFDNYEKHGILPPQYYLNIADYVRGGGALLTANGDSFAGENSLYQSAVGDILPGEPEGSSIKAPYRPGVTATGRRHIVTAPLAPVKGQAESWGRWFRTVPTHVKSGDVLLNGAENRPLLILDHVEKGRVAQLNSDHIWLWDRGFDGGGPHAELLRRLAHWLMKEPALAENSLAANIKQGKLTIERRDLKAHDADVTLIAPDGQRQNIHLALDDDGIGRWQQDISMPGAWRVEEGDLLAVAMAGRPNAPEMLDLRSRDDALAPLVKAGSGLVDWLDPHHPPSLRRTALNSRQHGANWVGLARRDQGQLLNSTRHPLIPPVLALVLGIGVLVIGWRREAR